MPCGGGGDEGGALVQRFHSAFARRRDGSGKFRDIVEYGGVSVGAVRVAQQDRIVASRSVRQDVCKPCAEGVAVGYVA
jgi:hypothetical protein